MVSRLSSPTQGDSSPEEDEETVIAQLPGECEPIEASPSPELVHIPSYFELVIKQPISHDVFSNMVKHTLNPEWPEGNNTLGSLYRADIFAVIQRFIEPQSSRTHRYNLLVRIIMLGVVLRSRARIFEFLSSPLLSLKPEFLLGVRSFFAKHTVADFTQHEPESDLIFPGIFPIAFPDIDLSLWAQYTAKSNLTVENAAARLSFSCLALDDELTALARGNFDKEFDEMLESPYAGFGALWMETYRDLVFQRFMGDSVALFASGEMVKPVSGVITRAEVEKWLDFYRRGASHCAGGRYLRWKGKRAF